MEDLIPLSPPVPDVFDEAAVKKRARTGLLFAALAAGLSFVSLTAFPGAPLAVFALVCSYRARAACRNALRPEPGFSVAGRALGWAALLRCLYLIVRFFASRAVSEAILPESLQQPGMPWILRTASRFVFTRLLLYFAGLR